MAVEWVKLMPECEFGLDSEYNKTYTHKYHVRTNSKGDMAVDVSAGSLPATSPGPASVPNMWETYSALGADIGASDGISDTGVFVQDKKVSRLNSGDSDDWYNWVITVTWRQPGEGRSGSNPPDPDSPLDDPTVYHVERAPYQRIVDTDKNGNEIANSAGDKFNPPIVIDDWRPVLVATYNYDGTDLAGLVSLMQEYRNAVNTTTFQGASARKVKVQSVDSSPLQEREGIPFYRVTWRFEFNEDTWDISVVDQGTQILVADVVNGGFHKQYPKVLKDNASRDFAKNIEPEDDPYQFLDSVFLNNDGTRKADDDPAEFKTFRVYPEKNLNSINFP